MIKQIYTRLKVELTIRKAKKVIEDSKRSNISARKTIAKVTNTIETGLYQPQSLFSYLLSIQQINF